MIKEIKQYKIDMTTRLGRGGFGCVYLGTDSSGSQYAIKIIQLRKDHHLKSLLNRELRIMSKLQNPSIVTMADNFIDQNALYIVLEYCEGGDLRNYFGKFQKQFYFPQNKEKYEELALQLFWGMLESLEYLYEQSIIHRDIKLENILISGGRFKLADFGLSKVLKDIDGEIMSSLLGTPYYQSPQQLNRLSYTPKTDIWSFGIVLYEIALNKLPFEGRSERDLFKNIEQSFKLGVFQLELKKINNQFLAFLIQRMVVINENDRISLKQLIEISNSFKSVMIPKKIQVKRQQMKQSKTIQYNISNTKQEQLSVNSVALIIMFVIITLLLSK